LRKQQQRKAVREVIRYRGKAIGGRILKKGEELGKVGPSQCLGRIDTNVTE